MSLEGPEISRLEAGRVFIKYNPYLCLADCDSLQDDSEFCAKEESGISR